MFEFLKALCTNNFKGLFSDLFLEVVYVSVLKYLFVILLSIILSLLITLSYSILIFFIFFPLSIEFILYFLTKDNKSLDSLLLIKSFLFSS